MGKVRRKSIKNREVRNMLCMNSNPEESKWGRFAPEGGCDEVVRNVDTDAKSVLCWKCTSRLTGGLRQK